MQQYTQGDDATLQFQATSDGITAMDITGATFESKVTDAQGTVKTYDNGHHTIVTAASGYFNLALSAAETASGTGPGLGVASIATRITQSAKNTTLHGDKILLVRSYP